MSKLNTLLDNAVDVVGITAVAFLAYSGVPAEVAQVLGGFVVSIALGKRYMNKQQ